MFVLFPLLWLAGIVASAADAPEAGQYHAVVIDAGSTGVRAHIFEWEPRACAFDEPAPLVVPRMIDAKSVRPGISSRKPDSVNQSLAQLVDFAESALAGRRGDWNRFPIYLMATAGLRRERPEQRDKLLLDIRDVLRRSRFHFQDDFVRILSGEEEGAFGWLALNAALGKLGSPQDSVGMLDLGGASFQITFVPQAGEVLGSSYPLLLGGTQTNLYSASYLQYGYKVAQRLLTRKLIAQSLVGEITPDLVHPCLPKGLVHTELLIGTEDDEGEAGNATPPLRAVWRGGGDYVECAAQVEKLFPKGGVCYNPPCTFGGRYQPRLMGRRFIAFSTFGFVARVLGLPSDSKLEDIEQDAKYICKQDWSTLKDRWRDEAEDVVRTLCFLATYTVALLHVGLGFEKKNSQIEFQENLASSPNITWAAGAIIWETNLRFNRRQPLCLPPERGNAEVCSTAGTAGDAKPSEAHAPAAEDAKSAEA